METGREAVELVAGGAAGGDVADVEVVGRRSATSAAGVLGRRSAKEETREPPAGVVPVVDVLDRGRPLSSGAVRRVFSGDGDLALRRDCWGGVRSLAGLSMVEGL